MKTKLVLVGGFLGAGKTSLLWEMAKRLADEGRTAGLITNDQETGLVDTKFLQTKNYLVKEVSGSCFCCNFGGFASAVEYVRETLGEGGVIFAEPVGSCTDLSATIMQPLKDKYSTEIDLAPLTVLADPDKIRKALDGWDSDASYIIAKQFEEADVILINKTDLLRGEDRARLLARAAEKWPHAKVMGASVKTGDGVAEWFDAVMATKRAGRTIAEVDYDIYAAGEAAYGWVNTTFEISAPGCGWAEAAGRLLDGLAARFAKEGVAVGHVKFLLQADGAVWLGNLTGGEETKSLRSYVHEAPGATLVVNGRAETAPELLEKIIAEEAGNCFGADHLKQVVLKSLVPGRPNPTYRYGEIVG